MACPELKVELLIGVQMSSKLNQLLLAERGALIGFVQHRSVRGVWCGARALMMRLVTRVAEVVVTHLTAEEQGATWYELVANVAFYPINIIGLLVNPGLELVPSRARGRSQAGVVQLIIRRGRGCRRA